MDHTDSVMSVGILKKLSEQPNGGVGNENSKIYDLRAHSQNSGNPIGPQMMNIQRPKHGKSRQKGHFTGQSQVF